MDPEIILRREPPTDLADVGEDMTLAASIRDEIRRGGPIPFARFMERCLYDPDGGYYRSKEARPGRSGDYVTAPELHPIFGATLSRLVDEAWRRFLLSPFTIREYGAGTGALGVPLLEAIDDVTLRAVVQYEPVEVDERRIVALRHRLDEVGFTRLNTPVDPLRPIDGVILANEVLDALPVHRVRQRGPRLRELAVGLGDDGSFTEVETEPSTSALIERLGAEGIDLADGQTAEICLAIDDWITAAAAGLARGLLVLIDYGAPATQLYDPVRRPDGTLRAYVRQQVHDDPYRHVGRQDITAHVDITAVEAAAHRAGLTTVGVTTQAEALMGLGIEERLQAIQSDAATSLEDYLLVRSALMRMLDPAAMGRFRVMAFGRSWPKGAPLSAFSYRLPRTAPD